MMFIKMCEPDGTEVIINADRIVCVVRDGKRCIIDFGAGCYFRSKLSLEEVEKAIREGIADERN